MKNSNIQCPAPRSTDDLQRRLMHNPREVYRNLQNSDQTFCHPPLTIFFRNILIHMWRCDKKAKKIRFLHCFIFASVQQMFDLRPEILRIYMFHEFERFTFFDFGFIFKISWSEVGTTKERHGATGSTEGSTRVDKRMAKSPRTNFIITCTSDIVFLPFSLHYLRHGWSSRHPCAVIKWFLIEYIF